MDIFHDIQEGKAKPERVDRDALYESRQDLCLHVEEAC